MISDHEFPWIVSEGYDMRCTRCEETGSVDDWLSFLERHSKCEDDQPPSSRRPE